MSTLYDPTPERREDETGQVPGHVTGEVHGEPAGEVPGEPAAPRRPSVLHLVVGLVFLGLAALWALSASGVVSSEDTWLVPGLLVVAGATGLVAALAGGRRGTR
jgi:hypothetical protein